MAITASLLGSTTSAVAVATTTITTSQPLDVGDIVVVAITRPTTAADTMGLNSLAVSSGAISWTPNAASASRALTFDLAVAVGLVTEAVPSGATITITSNSTAAKRGAVALRVQGADAVEMSTGNLAAGHIGNTSYGLDGTYTAIVAGQELPATTTPGSLVVAALAVGGTTAWTPADGWTLAAAARTTSGSGDRGVALHYRQQTTPGVETLSGSYASGSWALSAVSLTPADDEPGPEIPDGWHQVDLTTWDGDSWTPAALTTYDGATWQPTIILEAD